MSSDQTLSELVEIVSRNGDFKRNYGKIIGAYLYLRSISAVRGRSFFWNGFIVMAISGAFTWLEKRAG
jgi:hypothetical protein